MKYYFEEKTNVTPTFNKVGDKIETQSSLTWAASINDDYYRKGRNGKAILYTTDANNSIISIHEVYEAEIPLKAIRVQPCTKDN